MINNNNEVEEEEVRVFIEDILDEINFIYFETTFFKRILIDNIKDRELSDFLNFKNNKQSKYFQIKKELLKIKNDEDMIWSDEEEKTFDFETMKKELEGNKLNVIGSISKLETISNKLDIINQLK